MIHLGKQGDYGEQTQHNHLSPIRTRSEKREAEIATIDDARREGRPAGQNTGHPSNLCGSQGKSQRTSVCRSESPWFAWRLGLLDFDQCLVGPFRSVEDGFELCRR